MRQSILIVAYADDLHALAVVEKIKEVSEGEIEPVVIDLATFPMASFSSIALNQEGATSKISYSAPLPNTYASNVRYLLKNRSLIPIEDKSIKSVWWRRPRRPIPPNYDSAALEAYAERNTQDVVWSLFSLLGKRSLIVNEPFADLVASRKLLQLNMAAAQGIQIPRTLCTNDPSAAGEFISHLRSSGRKVIFKQVAPAPEGLNHFTQILQQEHEARLQEIRHTPILMQELVEGGVDVRVTVVGHVVFAMAHSPRTGKLPDIRAAENPVCWSVNPPDELVAKLLKLQDSMKLQFGAYDFKTDDSGNWYFLEVNPAGQWLFVETAIHASITESLARLLCFGSQACVPVSGKALTDDDCEHLLKPFTDAIVERALTTEPVFSSSKLPEQVVYSDNLLQQPPSCGEEGQV
jgi:glutathione synthase/RimK-type ligase-like ATP-grasp enzyme